MFTFLANFRTIMICDEHPTSADYRHVSSDRLSRHFLPEKYVAFTLLSEKYLFYLLSSYRSDEGNGNLNESCATLVII